MEDNLSLFALIFLSISPFIMAIMKSQRSPIYLDEPPFSTEGAEITAFPTCLHCGWQGALDVTEFVKAAARLEKITILNSPPCRNCGQRWKINLTTLVQKYRTGSLA